MFTGFRLVDKTLQSSKMVKLEFWSNNALKSDDAAHMLRGMFADVIPATETQFDFSSHKKKTRRVKRS